MAVLMFIFAALGGLGGLAAFLSWLDISPPQIDVLSMPRSGKLFLGLGLFVISMGLSGFGLFLNLRAPDIPEFDAPQANLIGGWGSSPGSCWVLANSDKFWNYRDHYRLASGCLVWDGLEDILDAPYLQPSKLFDIRKGSINVTAQWGASFPKYIEQTHSVGLYCSLMLVPIGINTSQFNTLREARNLGVKIVFNGLAKSFQISSPH